MKTVREFIEALEADEKELRKSIQQQEIASPRDVHLIFALEKALLWAYRFDAGQPVGVNT